MKVDYARRVSRQAFNKLVEAVEAGKSQKLLDYLKAMARFQNYSLGNVLLIGFQKPNATRVAGFRTWQKLGRHVKKGEHGCLLAHGDKLFSAPAFPVADVRDPTGAGDSFAGGFMGYLARRREFTWEALKAAAAAGTAVASFGVEELAASCPRSICLARRLGQNHRGDRRNDRVLARSRCCCPSLGLPEIEVGPRSRNR